MVFSVLRQRAGPLGRVQQLLKLVDGIAQFFRASEHPGDLGHVAALRDRRQLQYIRDSKLGHAMLGIFLQQIFQHCPRVRAIALEVGALILTKLVYSLALPGWHSSTMIRSKKSGAYSR
jgi:hypothetical protein